MVREKGRVVNILVIVALVAGAAATSLANLSRRHREPPTEPLEVVRNWEALASAGHRIGALAPRVTVVVFSDYQCATCRSWTSRMRKLVAKYPEDLAIVFRHYPLTSRPGSIEAAIAAECAAHEGKFLEMHVELLANSESLGDRTWADYARRVGMEDLVGFDECLKADRAPAAVSRDREAGRDAYVTATPTFYVGENMYTGLPWDLEEIVTRGMEAR